MAVKREIKFLGISSGICAPTAKGQIGAELGFDAIRACALSAPAPKKPDDFDPRRIFVDNDTKTVINVEDLYDYIDEMDDDSIFFDDLETPPANFRDNQRLARHIGYLREIFREIKSDVYETIKHKETPFIIAGDHSTAAATIAGIKKYLNKHETEEKKLGVIWIDAHIDAHTPYTTPTGNMHGMPIGLALNLPPRYGLDLEEEARRKHLFKKLDWIEPYWQELCLKDRERLRYSDLVYIGIRDYEPYERDLLKRGIKHYKYSDGAEIGGKPMGGYFQNMRNEWGEEKTIQQVCEETILYFAKNKYTHLYVSFDIDSITSKNLKNANLQSEINQKDEPIYGTGTPVENGLKKDEAKFILNYFWEQSIVPVTAIEIVEVSPLLDFQNRTAEVAFDIIQHLVKTTPL